MKLGDFIDRVCDDYGGTVREPKGGSLSARAEYSLRFVVRTDSEGKYRTLPIPPGMNPNVEVIAPVLRSFCKQLGIEPADFGVAEEEGPEE